MKVLKIKTIGDCLEGTNVRDLLFDSEITEDFVFYLKPLGKLVYNTSFDKPFFRLIVRGKYTLKGSVGNKTLRVLLPTDADDAFIREFSAFVEGYK